MEKFEHFWNRHNWPEENRGMAAAIWFEASGQVLDDNAAEHYGNLKNATQQTKTKTAE